MSADGDRLKDLFDGDLDAFAEVRAWPRNRVRFAVGKRYAVDGKAVGHVLAELRNGGTDERTAVAWAKVVRDQAIRVPDGDPVKIDVNGPRSGPAAEGVSRLASVGEDGAEPLTAEDLDRLVAALDDR